MIVHWPTGSETVAIKIRAYLMSLLTDLKNLFLRRKQPVVVDITQTQAGAFASSAEAVEAPDGAQSAKAAQTTEPKSPKAKPTPAPRRSNDAVASQLREITERVETQSDQVRQLVQLQEQVPRALETLGNLNRHSAQLVELATDQSESAKSQYASFNAALGQIRGSSEHQIEVLGLIQQQTDATTRSVREIAEAMENINRGLVEIADNVRGAIDMLSVLDRSGEDAQTRLGDFVARSQRWTVLAMAGCAAASVLAVIVAAIALIQRTGG